MYQAQITDPITKQPITDPAAVATVARRMNPSAPQFEEVDAEQGIWLIALRPAIALVVENAGAYDTHAGNGTDTYAVSIEMP